MANMIDAFNAAKSEYKTTTQHGVQDLQREAKRAVTETDDTEELERTFKGECSKARATSEQGIQQIQQKVLSHKPSPSDPNYERRNEEYNSLLRHSIHGIEVLQRWMGDLFDEVFNILIDIVHWVKITIVGISYFIDNAFKRLHLIFFTNDTHICKCIVCLCRKTTNGHICMAHVCICPKGE
jgi:hypothetical protein